MNNRIKELMVQAGFDPAAIERMGVMPQAEKFAELIVNDVLNIVAINGEQCNCSTLFRNISEHFGVTQ